MLTPFSHLLKSLSLAATCVSFLFSFSLQAMTEDEDFWRHKAALTNNPNRGIYEAILQPRFVHHIFVHPTHISFEDDNLQLSYSLGNDPQPKKAVLFLEETGNQYGIGFIDSGHFFSLETYGKEPTADDLFNYFLAWRFVNEERYNDAADMFNYLINSQQLKTSLRNQAQLFFETLTDPNFEEEWEEMRLIEEDEGGEGTI